MTPIIWGRVTSSNVQKVLWACAELNILYDRRDAGLEHGVVNEPSYRLLNPHGLVPTLVDGDVVIWESNTILRYLADTRGGTDLYPAAPAARSLVDRWLDWQLGTLSVAMSPLFHLVVRTPAAARDPAVVRDLADKAASVWARLDARLAAVPYVAGEALTLADISMGNAIHRWSVFPITRPDLPHLAAWHRRLAARPGFRDSIAAVPVV